MQHRILVGINKVLKFYNRKEPYSATYSKVSKELTNSAQRDSVQQTARHKKRKPFAPPSKFSHLGQRPTA